MFFKWVTAVNFGLPEEKRSTSSPRFEGEVVGVPKHDGCLAEFGVAFPASCRFLKEADKGSPPATRGMILNASTCTPKPTLSATHCCKPKSPPLQLQCPLARNNLLLKLQKPYSRNGLLERRTSLADRNTAM
eukprot:505008-Amphidinium_carterae.1